jgi:uncharacterized protein (TIGR02466 family)
MKLNPFEIPLFEYNIEDIDYKTLEQYIIECGYSQMKDIESNISPHIKKNLKESDFKFLLTDDPIISSVRTALEEKVREVINELNPNLKNVYVELFESWYHITENGGYHDVHNHPNCSWSGVLCVNPGEGDGGEFKLLNPITSFHYDIGSTYIKQTIQKKFKQGDLLLFPSYILHQALPYFGNDKRIVIAFNVRVY